MKVFSCPESIKPPVVDFANYDPAQVERSEASHLEQVKDWLARNGFTGPNSGRIFRASFADSHAEYVMAEGPNLNSFLMRLPYGDGWHDPNVEFLSEAEVLRRMDAQDELDRVLAEARAAREEQAAEAETVPGL